MSNTIRNFSIDGKINVFRKLLTSENEDASEIEVLNVFRMINSYNTFDDDFFTNEMSYISDIAEFIDLKTALAKEIAQFIQEMVTWYLSILTSCEIPLTVEQDDAKKPLPKFMFALFQLCTLPLMSSLMKKANLELAVTNLVSVKNGFNIASTLFVNQNLVGAFLNRL